MTRRKLLKMLGAFPLIAVPMYVPKKDEPSIITEGKDVVITLPTADEKKVYHIRNIYGGIVTIGGTKAAIEIHCRNLDFT